MLVYIIFYFILVLFSSCDFLEIQGKRKDNLYTLFKILLILFVGLRYKVANDWNNYLSLTKQIESVPEILSGNYYAFANETSIEIGFKLIISIINTFFNAETSNSLQVLTFLITLFCYSVLFKVVKNQEEIKYKFLFISTFVGFTMFREFDILRQSIAFYLFFYSIQFIGKDFKRYLGYNIFGVFFHTSAVIFFPLYFVFKSNFKKSVLFILLFFHCFTMFIRFSFISEILEFFSGFFPELVFVQKIYNYTSELQGGNSLSLVGVLYAIYLFLILINYQKSYLNINLHGKIFINAFLIFIIVNIIFSDSKEIADRFSYFFYFGLAFVFVFVIDLLPKKLIFPYIILVLVFPYIRFTRIISEPKTKSVIVPYRNYFFVSRADEDEILANWNNKYEESLEK